jgi:4-amino-4-deoxy-L-arabinose transferase-like glycosyltransferase
MVSPPPNAVRQSVMVLAIGFALYAQLAVHQTPTDMAAWGILAVAALLAAVAAGARAPVDGAALPPAANPPSPAARLGLGALAVAAIAAATSLSTARSSPVLALLCWLSAPLLASAAVRGWQVTPARRAAAAWSGRELGTLAALLVLAALARTLWIRTLPRTYFGDEPRVAMYLSEAYGHNVMMPSFFSMGWNTWPAIGLALQGLFTPLFGVHMWTLRLSSALMGTLGVLAVYLLARELYTRRAALLAACLFAICRTAIDFSRLGVAHAQVLFLEPLAFFLLWRALNGGRALAYLSAGVATAWCLYTYNAGQLVPPLVFGWLALGALVRPSRLRTHWRGAALLTAAFALTLFPYLFYFTDHFTFGPNWDQWTIMARNRQTLGQVLDAWRTSGAAPAWDILSHQSWTTWLGFGVLPGGGYALGYRKGGMLDDVSAALFVLGLGMSIRRLRRGGDAFVLYWWLATVLFGGIATIDPPSFVRMVGLLPALALLAALPLEWLAGTAPRGVRAIVPAAIAAALLLAAAWDNYRTYFVEFASTQSDPMSELARYIETLPPDHRAALLGVEHFLQFRGELFLIEFPGRWRDVAEPAHFLPLHEPITAPLALVLGPTQTTLSEELHALYPGAAIIDVSGVPDAPPIFRAVVVTPDDARQGTGLALVAQRRDGSTSAAATGDPFAEPAPADAERLLWSGSIYWPTDQPLAVTVNAAQPTAITFGDGITVRADGAQAATAMVSMPRGWQPVRIEEAAAAQRRLAIALGPGAASRSLTRWDFRPQTTREGLVATYLRGDGSTVHAIDPQLDAFAVEDRFPPDGELLARTPFTATWRGALRVELPGAYDFEGIGSGPYAVRLDGAPLLAATPQAPEEPAASRATRTLAAGLHPIEVEFDSTKASHTTRRLFQLFWTPPGGSKRLIPPANFVPTTGG